MSSRVRAVDIRTDPGAAADEASRGAGSRRGSPSPPPPRLPAPGSRGSAFLGSLFFRGSRFWTVAIGCHSAFPRPDAAIMLAPLRDVSAGRG